MRVEEVEALEELACTVTAGRFQPHNRGRNSNLDYPKGIIDSLADKQQVVHHLDSGEHQNRLEAGTRMPMGQVQATAPSVSRP